MWQRRGPESQLSVPPQLFIDSLSNGSQFSDTSAQIRYDTSDTSAKQKNKKNTKDSRGFSVLQTQLLSFPALEMKQSYSILDKAKSLCFVVKPSLTKYSANFQYPASNNAHIDALQQKSSLLMKLKCSCSHTKCAKTSPYIITSQRTPMGDQQTLN